MTVRRLRLRRNDGAVYLDRWGWRCRWFGVYLHRMTAPDPGRDLHDHPWWFASLILRGGYCEERAETRVASRLSLIADAYPETCRPGLISHRYAFSSSMLRTMRMDECHRITALHRNPTWTLVLTGPNRRSWGFYEPDGFVRAQESSTARRPMYADIGADATNPERAS
jgi:hypothetical protein